MKTKRIAIKPARSATIATLYLLFGLFGMSVVVNADPAWPNEEELRRKVLDLVQEDENQETRINFVDLNEDGIPEALVTVISPIACGAMGCDSRILDLTGPEAVSIGDYIAMELKPLPTKTNGWRDVSLNGVRTVTFQDGRYGR